MLQSAKIAKANEMYSHKNYSGALAIYKMLSSEDPLLAKVLKGNIERCYKKISSETDFAGNLDADANVVSGSTILFISHEASITGAPLVLLRIIKWMVKNLNVNAYIIIGGKHTDLKDDFEKLGTCLWVDPVDNETNEKIRLLVQGITVNFVYANTVVSGSILERVYNLLGSKVVYISHIHEKENVLNQFKAEEKIICKISDKIITVSDTVTNRLSTYSGKRAVVSVFPPFIDLYESDSEDIDNRPRMIWGCGTIEHRKGFDLFCETIEKLSHFEHLNFKAGWIGLSHGNMDSGRVIDHYNIKDLFVLLGKQANPRAFYRKGDIFFLSSREEPFSLAAIEAAEQGLPILTFDKSCCPAMDAFVHKYGCGLVTTALDTSAASDCLKLLLEHSDMSEAMGRKGHVGVVESFTTEGVVPTLVDFIESKRSSPSKRKVVVVSLGPVPVEGLKTMEGGGLRAWGLAKGLAKIQELEVSLIFPRWFHDASVLGLYDDVMVSTWSDENDVITQLTNFDIVVASYCFGGLSLRIANEVRSDQILVLDCYVPIHPEVCARNSNEQVREFNSFISDSAIWNEVLIKGDFLLCASEAQKNYYFGLLFGLGKIDPVNYGYADNLIVAPFGINGGAFPPASELPITSLVSAGSFKLLWFGGVYPWFDLEILIEAVRKIRDNQINVELVIVGAKNPFNTHPDFIRSTNKILELSASKNYSQFVHICEWVPYEKIHEWYLDSDLVVTFNRDGIENRFAWRTRVLDYLQYEVKFATNGGDPISDVLIDKGLGFRISDESVEKLADDLTKVITVIKSGSLLSCISDLKDFKNSLTWETIGLNIFRKLQTVWKFNE